MAMNAPSDLRNLLVDAFALTETRGVALLESLGRFDVWRGNLDEMRGDPGAPASSEEAHRDVDEYFHRAAVVHKALGYLQPRCQQTLRLTYVNQTPAVELAQALQTTPTYAETLVENCTQRLLEVVAKIESDDVEAGSSDTLRTSHVATEKPASTTHTGQRR
jgi:DNA-directed RNA polymerase specialized sigma24 family protein